MFFPVSQECRALRQKIIDALRVVSHANPPNARLHPPPTSEARGNPTAQLLGGRVQGVVRPHRASREYRSPSQRISTLLRHEVQRPTHRRLENLMARTRTTSRNRMARSLQSHGSDGADGR